MKDESKTTDLLEVEIVRGQEWYRRHKEHVDHLIKEAHGSHSPTGSDCIHPQLWKSSSWNGSESKDMSKTVTTKYPILRAYAFAAGFGAAFGIAFSGALLFISWVHDHV